MEYWDADLGMGNLDEEGKECWMRKKECKNQREGRDGWKTTTKKKKEKKEKEDKADWEGETDSNEKKYR